MMCFLLLKPHFSGVLLESELGVPPCCVPHHIPQYTLAARENKQQRISGKGLRMSLAARRGEAHPAVQEAFILPQQRVRGGEGEGAHVVSNQFDLVHLFSSFLGQQNHDGPL